MEQTKIALCEKKSDCCACGACKAVCPKNAIKMQLDENGFCYPVIDENVCIKCGSCMRVCAFKRPNELVDPTNVYAASSKSRDLYEKSASGGLFAVIASAFLSKKGIVYGASFEKIGKTIGARHIRIEDKKDLPKIQGSKYVQSKMDIVYENIKEDLSSGRLVLFSGTPCQVAELKFFLNRKYDNLFTVDIICHGVPDEEWFAQYLSILEKKINGKIYDYKFRDKTYGQGYFTKILYTDQNGNNCEKYCDGNLTSYLHYFLNADILRENCYSCPYAGAKRISDITLGDYWGVNIVHKREIEESDLTFENGISCVLVNSEKGKSLFEEIKSEIIYFESDIEKVSAYNSQLKSPVKSKGERVKLLALFNEGGYEKVEEYFKQTKKLYRLKHRIKGLIPKNIRNILKGKK